MGSICPLVEVVAMEVAVAKGLQGMCLERFLQGSGAVCGHEKSKCSDSNDRRGNIKIGKSAY
jgi:hypothetical protein